jgi:hypothetical protein
MISKADPKEHGPRHRGAPICRFAGQMLRRGYSVAKFDSLQATDGSFFANRRQLSPRFRGLSCSRTQKSPIVARLLDLAAIVSAHRTAHDHPSIPWRARQSSIAGPQAPPARAASLVGDPRRARGPPVDRRDDTQTMALGIDRCLHSGDNATVRRIAAKRCSAVDNTMRRIIAMNRNR